MNATLSPSSIDEPQPASVRTRSLRLTIGVIIVLVLLLVAVPLLIVFVYKSSIDAQWARLERIESLGGEVDEEWPVAHEISTPGRLLGEAWEPPFVGFVSVRGPARADFETLLVEVGAVRKMGGLSFDGVPVKDGQLQSLASRQSLRILRLTGTDVTDDGLADLAEFQNLRVLDLVAANVTDDGIDSLAQIRTLKQIDLRHSRVTEAGAKRLRDALPNTTVLVCPAPTERHLVVLRDILRRGGFFLQQRDSNNDPISLGFMEYGLWEDFDWASLSEVHGIWRVYLQNALPPQRALTALSQSREVESLNIGHASLDQVASDQIGNMQRLRELHFYDCQIDFTDFKPHLKRLQFLESLSFENVSDMQIDAESLRTLFSLPSLRKLTLQSCQLDNHALAQLPPAVLLEEVDLKGSNLTDVGFQGLARCQKLKGLDLSDTKITDASIDAINSLPCLQHVQVSTTGVSDEGQLKIRNLYMPGWP